MQHQVIEIFLGRLYPRAMPDERNPHPTAMTYLHRDQTVIYQNLFGEEICAYCGFVTGTKLFVDLRGVR